MAGGARLHQKFARTVLAVAADMNGKIVIVTGATSGIGRVVAVWARRGSRGAAHPGAGLASHQALQVGLRQCCITKKGDPMALEIRGVAPLLQVFDMPEPVRFHRDMLGGSYPTPPPRAAGSDGHPLEVGTQDAPAGLTRRAGSGSRESRPEQQESSSFPGAHYPLWTPLGPSLTVCRLIAALSAP